MLTIIDSLLSFIFKTIMYWNRLARLYFHKYLSGKGSFWNSFVLNTLRTFSLNGGPRIAAGTRLNPHRPARRKHYYRPITYTRSLKDRSVALNFNRLCNLRRHIMRSVMKCSAAQFSFPVYCARAFNSEYFSKFISFLHIQYVICFSTNKKKKFKALSSDNSNSVGTGSPIYSNK